jgi:fructose-1,6-bisphosphatase/inositol monophosphatase family enzyme
MNPSFELQTAIDAAKAGGELALKYFQTELDVKTKKDNSIVTVADVEAEKEIIKYITKAFPDAKFLAEESGGNIKENDFWIIDPIDGTRVFVRGIPQWSILIAHYKNNEVITGICYIPTQNILISSEKNRGAYINGKRTRVSKTDKPQKSFGSFGSITRFKEFESVLRLKEANIPMRSYEHAYALCLLASGNFDFVIDAYGTPWDYAPFACIVPEAGGKLTDFEGKKWHLNSKSLLATNGILHDEIVKIINKKRPKLI